jgi:hypothetical protein
METAIIISIVLFLLGSPFLFIPKLWNKTEKQITRLSYAGFLLSFAGLAVTIFTVATKVINIDIKMIDMRKQIEKQMRQIEEKMISKPDTITIYRNIPPVVIRDTIFVDRVRIPENEFEAVDRHADSALRWLERELEKQKLEKQKSDTTEISNPTGRRRF